MNKQYGWTVSTFIVALICTFAVNNAKADVGGSAGFEQSGSTDGVSGAGEETNFGCVKGITGVYDCTTDINVLKKWRAWEESKKKVTKMVPTTAYTSRVEETDDSPCISADGSDICKRYANGETLYATNDIPLGTKVKVDGVIGTVVDRMNRRYTGTGRIDVYMGHNLKAARAHGLKMATLEIIN